MDWDTYKRLCDRPDHWTRWMLEQCIDLLGQLERADLSAPLLNVVQQSPIPVPADYTGSTLTDVFVVELAQGQRLAILSAIIEAQRLGLTTPQTAARGLGGFVEAWREYAAFGAIDA